MESNSCNSCLKRHSKDTLKTFQSVQKHIHSPQISGGAALQVTQIHTVLLFVCCLFNLYDQDEGLYDGAVFLDIYWWESLVISSLLSP